MGILDRFKSQKKEAKTSPSYNQEVVAKAVSIIRDQSKEMDFSQYIGPGGFKSKKEVEANLLIVMLLRVTKGSLNSDTLIEIVKDQYGMDDETSQSIVRLTREHLSL